jgi:2-polyprenyl-3-methyl-5-hydroxy-6-metoxy-1,4-benzoquinol methylase
MAGAREVTAIDNNWSTWPQNIHYAIQMWRVNPEIITGDFRTFHFQKRYDVIFLLGVLYHLEDVFTPMRTLSGLLEDNGTLYIETQMSKMESPLPLFEYASDVYPTTAIADKGNLSRCGHKQLSVSE